MLLALLLLFLLRQVVTDHAAGGSTRDGVMSGDVACHTANYGTLDATLRVRGLRANKQRDAEYRCGEQLQLEVDCP